MSRIKAAAYGQKDNEITRFLQEEGFKEASWHGGKCFQFVACGKTYCVWVNIFPNYIDLYAEYDCGGEVDSLRLEFDGDDIDSFKEEYEDVLEFVQKWTGK